MSDWLQWIIAVAVILLVYFWYIHGVIKQCRINKIQIGMTGGQVRKVLGRPNKVTKHGSNDVYCYKIWHSNRLAPDTRINVHVEFSRGKVTYVHQSER